MSNRVWIQIAFAIWLAFAAVDGLVFHDWLAAKVDLAIAVLFALMDQVESARKPQEITISPHHHITINRYDSEDEYEVKQLETWFGDAKEGE